MPYIMNALQNTVSTQAHGKWFTWKPLEIKTFHNEKLSEFIYQNRAEEGLVDIPEQVMELDKASPEYKEIIEERRRQGVEGRIRGLDRIKNNLVNSLAMDYSTAGLKGDHLAIASKGELAAIKELNSLRGEVEANQLRVADEVRKELGLDVSGSTAKP
jgi:hypothetical protein